MLDTLLTIFTPGTLLFMLRGAGVTVALSLVGIVGGTVIGLVGAAVQTYPQRWLWGVKVLLRLYVGSFRRVPLLLILLLAYVGLTALGETPANFVVASVAVVLYAGGYLMENFRSGIESLPQDQWNAARSISLSHTQALVYVIIPQGLRVSIAACMSFIQSLIKDTSMAVIIGLVELTRVGVILRYEHPLESFWIFLALMIAYFLICSPFAYMSDRLERSFETDETR